MNPAENPNKKRLRRSMMFLNAQKPGLIKDAYIYGCDSIIHTVTNHKHLGNGSIILMHNGAKYTKDALEKMIICLKEQGYEFVKVSELIYPENYKMDHEGRQYVEGLTCPPQANVTKAPAGTLREY